jgi:3-oxoacyl-[acyl-carrier protein] reductase
MTDTLLGEVAIVTGSARNIGRAIANELSDSGASVVIHGQGDRASADAVRGEITDKGGNAIV